jgi:hypothetical protein
MFQKDRYINTNELITISGVWFCCLRDNNGLVLCIFMLPHIAKKRQNICIRKLNDGRLEISGTNCRNSGFRRKKLSVSLMSKVNTVFVVSTKKDTDEIVSWNEAENAASSDKTKHFQCRRLEKHGMMTNKMLDTIILESCRYPSLLDESFGLVILLFSSIC